MLLKILEEKMVEPLDIGIEESARFLQKKIYFCTLQVNKIIYLFIIPSNILSYFSLQNILRKFPLSQIVPFYQNFFICNSIYPINLHSNIQDGISKSSCLLYFASSSVQVSYSNNEVLHKCIFKHNCSYEVFYSKQLQKYISINFSSFLKTSR